MSTFHSNYSLQFVMPVINKFVDDLLVKILPTGAHSVFEIVQSGNQNAIGLHALLHSLSSNGFKSRLLGTIQMVR